MKLHRNANNSTYKKPQMKITMNKSPNNDIFHLNFEIFHSSCFST